MEIESNIKLSPNRFWHFVNSKRKTNGYPSTMFLDNLVASNQVDISNLFADFFEGVYSTISNSSVNNISCGQVFSTFKLELDSVLSELLNIDINQSAGSDRIPPLVLKMTANAIASPITALFNRSLSQGHFPEVWKCSIIKPIFKSGLRSDIKNYRGISILSVLPKLFEKLVRDHLFFYTKRFISPKQHGFYPGRSSVSNLFLITNFISTVMSKGGNVQVVYTDFSKAFDKLDHRLLLSKLTSLDCNSLPIPWIKSYLEGRTQTVKIGNHLSKLINVTSGVPQGSHLGPLLFIIFINDIVKCLQYSEILIYADDIKIFKAIDNSQEAHEFQLDLKSFCNWCSSHHMLLNISKCKTMCFSRSRIVMDFDYFLNDNLIEKVKLYKDLGIIFKFNLSFHNHIQYCISKAHSMLGFVKRFSKDFYDPYVLKILYISFVRSQLEYGLVIWDPYYQESSDRIESVQKKFLKYALRRLPRDNHLPLYILPPYRGRCKLLALEPLYIRRIAACGTFVRDVLVSKMDCTDILRLFSFYVPSRNFRSRGDFIIKLPACKTNFSKSDPAYIVSTGFNKIRSVFDLNLSREMFKRLMSNYLLIFW